MSSGGVVQSMGFSPSERKMLFYSVCIPIRFTIAALAFKYEKHPFFVPFMVLVSTIAVVQNTNDTRSERKYSRETYVKSANIIQVASRKYLEHRYKSLCANFDDDEFIMLNPVKLIPRNLLIVLENQAFHCGYLLKWILKSQKPIHPLTREPLKENIKVECVSKIIEYLYTDSKNFRNLKRGYYKRRNNIHSVTKQWQKCQFKN